MSIPQTCIKPFPDYEDVFNKEKPLFVLSIRKSAGAIYALALCLPSRLGRQIFLILDYLNNIRAI